MSAATLERGGITGSAALEVALAALREEFDLRFDAKCFRRQALVEQGFRLGAETGQYRLFERFRKQPEPEKRFPRFIRYVHSPLRCFA
jgi:hypothetical protein